LKNSQIQELVSESCFSWGNMVWHSNICLKFNSCNDVHWLICYSILKEVFLICAGSFLWMGMCCRWLNVYCDIFNTLVFCYLQWTTSWNNQVLFSIILNKQNLLTLICFVCLWHWHPLLFFLILDLCNNALQKFEGPKWRLRFKRICFVNSYLSWN
jgi:hypothetical protein